MRGIVRILLSIACVAWLAGCQESSKAGPESNEAGINSSASADARPAASGRLSIKRVSAEIDFSDSAKVAEQIENFASALDGSALVHLDLTIIPAGEPDPNYRVMETPRVGAPKPLACDSGDRLESRAFGFAFNPDYNHLLLEILHAPPEAAPFSTAACAYRGGSDAPAFTIQGYYAVSAVSIPTANDIQLRPVNPAFHD